MTKSEYRNVRHAAYEGANHFIRLSQYALCIPIIFKISPPVNRAAYFKIPTVSSNVLKSVTSFSKSSSFLVGKCGHLPSGRIQYQWISFNYLMKIISCHFTIGSYRMRLVEWMELGGLESTLMNGETVPSKKANNTRLRRRKHVFFHYNFKGKIHGGDQNEISK